MARFGSGWWLNGRFSPAITQAGAGGGGAAPYEGFVATRGLTHTIQNGSTQSMCRRAHHATDDITSLKVLFAGWYADNTGESALGETSTWECAIEYPEGVYTRVKFGGADIGSCPSGDTLVSDACAVTIPDGAEFWTRTYQNNASKILLRFLDNSYSIQAKNNLWFGSGVSNVVMGGALGGGSPGPNLTAGPLGIIGQTTKASIVILGDSICAAQGFDSTVDADSGEMGAVRPGMNDIGYCDMSYTSTQALGLAVATAPRRSALGVYCSHIFSNLGTNDVPSAGAATTLTRQETISTGWGKPIVCSTLTPFTSSTDGWATVGNQTVLYPAIITYNDALRAMPAWLHGYAEVADTVESARNSGKWNPNLTGDGVHPNTAGYDAMIAGGAYTSTVFVL